MDEQYAVVWDSNGGDLWVAPLAAALSGARRAYAEGKSYTRAIVLIGNEQGMRDAVELSKVSRGNREGSVA